MSLIARYKLDGNARDSEGTAHGTAIDVTWAPSQLVDGGGEARLNGTTSRIDTGIQFTTETAVSLPVWFRPREGAGHLVGQHDGINGLAIEQTETGKIRLVVNGTASGEVTVYPGEYHHAAPVYDNSEATLYLDNEAVASVTATVIWPAVPITIGARADGSQALIGDVVDVRGYEEAITENNVFQLNDNPDLGAFDPGYVPGNVGDADALFTMEDIDGAALLDATGSYEGVISGASQVVDAGKHGLEFDGVDDYVAIPLKDLGDEGFVAMAVRPLSSSEGIFGGHRSTNGGDRLQLGVNGLGKLSCAITSMNYQDSLTGTSIAAQPGTDYVVFLSWKNGLFRLYVDNELALEENYSGVVDTGNSDWYLGGNAPGSVLKDCIIWDFRPFDHEVPETEHGALYDAMRLGIDRGFPYSTRRSLAMFTGPFAAYNPHPTPVPNPTAIPRSGRSSVQGISVLLAPPVWFDQRDGSGGSHLSPAGVVSRPDRQGRLSGNTTDQNGQPVSRRVRCFERKTGRIVRETWSNAAGYYQFDDLDPTKRFTVVAHDYSGTYNAVIADNAQPEVPS